MDPRHINNLWINGLLQTFSDMGLDVAALSRGMKSIDGGRLAAGCQLDLVEARTLWHRAVAESPHKLLGIEVGKRLSPRSTGLLFPLLLHCPSVRTGLELLVRYQALISENGSFRLNGSDAASGIVCEYIPAHSIARSRHGLRSPPGSSRVRSVAEQDIPTLPSHVAHRIYARFQSVKPCVQPTLSPVHKPVGNPSTKPPVDNPACYAQD